MTPRKRSTNESKRVITTAGNQLVFTFPFDNQIKDELKAAGKGSFRFNGPDKSWRIPVDSLNKEVVGLAVKYGFKFNDEVDALLDAAKDVVAADAPTGQVTVINAQLQITLTGRLDRQAFAEYRSLKGYRWSGGEVSTATITDENMNWLEAHNFTGIEWARKAAVAVAEAATVAEAAAAERLESSKAAESDLDLSAVVPEGLAPYPFQVAGVEYALKARRTFIGDEMGLGKTVQAILAVEAAKRARA